MSAERQLTMGQQNLVATHYNELQALAGRDEFRAKNVPASNSQLGRWHEAGLLAVVRVEAAERHEYRIWTLKDPVVAYIDELADRGPIMPCGHRGIRNLGDAYSCTLDRCDERFGRAAAATALGGGADGV